MCETILYTLWWLWKQSYKILVGDHNGSRLRRQPRAVVVVSALPVSGSTLQQPLKLAWPKPTACVAMVMSALLLR